MQKLDSQREKSMEGTMNPVEFYMISGFFQVLCICFPFIPEFPVNLLDYFPESEQNMDFVCPLRFSGIR